MTRLERWAWKAWLFVTALAAVAMFAGALLIMLTFLILPIPLVMLAYKMPTVWIYLTPALLIYAALRLGLRRVSFPKPVMALFAVALPVAAGFIIPARANREIESRVAATMRDDFGTEPHLQPVETVALLKDADFLQIDGQPDFKCWDYCQRLLFSGWAKRFFLAPLEAMPPAKTGSLKLMRHEIVDMPARCDHSQLYATYADRSEWDGPPPPPYLWDKLGDFAEQGKCFRSEPTSDNRADVYLVDHWDFDPKRRQAEVFNPSLMPIRPFRRRMVVRNDNGRLVPLMRRTRVTYSLLATPLQITPPFNFATKNEGHWTYTGERTLGIDPPVGPMRDWLANDLRIKGLGSERITVTAKRKL